MRCNLTPNAAWSIGTEVLLPTDDDLALEIKPCDIPDSKKEGDVDHEDGDDALGDQSDEEGEKGASCRIKIMPSINENGTQSP